MLWKLCNGLFGWDYVYWQNFADQGIARVHVDGNGKPFYWRYKAISLADEITQNSQVMWLTCPSSKYLPK